MWPFMNEESDWMLINDDLRGRVNRWFTWTTTVFKLECTCGHIHTSDSSYFEDKVWRRARPHCGSEDPVMVGVDQCFIQIQNQNLPFYCIWSFMEKYRHLY